MTWRFVHRVWALDWCPRKLSLGAQTLCMALLLVAAMTHPARADCPAAPIADPDDMAISFLAANGVQAASASLLASTVKEGIVVYDDANDTLKLCDGNNWIAVGSGSGTDTLASLSCAAGQIAKFNGTVWACAADGGGASGALQSEIQTTDPLTLANAVWTDVVSLTTATTGTYTIFANGYTNTAQPWLYMSSNCNLLVDGTVVQTQPFYYGAHNASAGSSPSFPHAMTVVSELTAGQVVKVQCMSSSDSATRRANKWRIDLVPVGGGDTLAGLSCSNGEIAKWNGSAWACAADGGGGSGGTEVAFRAKTGAITIAASTVATGYTENYDTADSFNPTTGVFTAPLTGRYLFTGSSLNQGAAVTNYYAYFSVNGVLQSYGSRAQAGASQPYPISTVSAIYSLAAGDTVAFAGNSSPSTTYTFEFSGALLNGSGGGSASGGTGFLRSGALSLGTVYGPANTDGLLIVMGRQDGATGLMTLSVNADTANPPTTSRAFQHSYNNSTYYGSVFMSVPIKKGEFYRILCNNSTACGGSSFVGGASYYFVSLGSADTLAGLACATNDIPKWDGSAWACAADGGGSGGGAVVAFSARRTAGNVTSGNTVIFDSASINTGAGYNAATGVFTAPVAGTYQFSWGSIGNISTNDIFRLVLRKNGVSTSLPQARSYNSYGSEYPPTATALGYLPLSQGDTVNVHFQSDNGTALYGTGGYAFFNGHLLGGGADALSGLSCATNEIPKWNGTVWACAADDGGGGGSQVAFSVNKGNTAQTVSAGADTALTWSTKAFDTATNFNLGTGRFTPTTAGKYLLMLTVRCSSAATRCIAIIKKNGSSASWTSSAGGATYQHNTAIAMALVDMNGTTDYAEASVYNDAGTSVYGETSFTHFDGFLLGGGGSDTLTGLSCATNEIPKWNGTAWACATDGGGASPLSGRTLATQCSYTWSANATGWRDRTWIAGDCTNGLPEAGDVATGWARNGNGTAGMVSCAATTGSHYNHPTFGATSGTVICSYFREDAGGGGSDTLAGLSCATNEIPKWNGTAWACAADGGGAGGDPASYLVKGMSANQSSLASGTVISFTTLLSSAGSKITHSGNRITVAGGSRYMLRAFIRQGTAGSALDYRIYDVTNGANVPSSVASANSNSNFSDTDATAFVAPSASTTYEVRVNSGGGSALSGYSYFSAVELGGGSTTAAGDEGQIQFNDGSDGLAADGALHWDNANKRLGIGTATPSAMLEVQKDGGPAGLSLLSFGTAGSVNSSIVNVRGTAGTVASPGLLAADDRIGGYLGSTVLGASGTKNIASMEYYADGAYTTTSAPTRITFSTTPTGADARAERMRITSGGNIGIGTTTPASKLHVAGGVQLGNDADSCPGASNVKLGTLRVNSGVLELCGSGGWNAVGGGVPSGTIAAFASATCPTGWTEYVASRGRFLRGIDNGAGNDPDGTRTPGNVQADAVGPHTHDVLSVGSNGQYESTNEENAIKGTTMQTTDTGTTGPETRPKNVAVLFCQYAGGAPLTATPSGAAGEIQYSDGAGGLASDPNIVVSGSKVGIGTTSPQSKLEVVNAAGGTVADNYIQITGSTANNTNYPGISLKGGSLADSYPRIAVNNGGYGLYLGGGTSGVVSDRAGMTFDSVAGTSFTFGATNAMQILPTGNVGIGTTAPAEKLDLGGGNIKMGYQQVSNNCASGVDCVATCPAGKYVLSGGCWLTSTWAPMQHEPNGNSAWHCMSNGSSVRVTAVCANIR